MTDTTHKAIDLHLRRIGTIVSPLRGVDQAPRQGNEGAPDAWIEIGDEFATAVRGLGKGDTILVITWLDRADREILEVHPRGDRTLPLTGVFATRSPHRPNPLGLHRVTLHEIDGCRLLVGPIEAIDGTPVIDIKPALDGHDG